MTSYKNLSLAIYSSLVPTFRCLVAVALPSWGVVCAGTMLFVPACLNRGE